jgi:hypothetical protein
LTHSLGLEYIVNLMGSFLSSEVTLLKNFGWLCLGKLQFCNSSHDWKFTSHKRHGWFFGRCPSLLTHGWKT